MALASFTMHLDIPSSKLAAIGVNEDCSNGQYPNECEKLATWIAESLPEALEFSAPLEEREIDVDF